MTSSPRSPGRPRAGIDDEVFAAALRTVDELGYPGATMDRIAAAAGVAKTTLYRRWPSKGALITDCLIHTFGPLPPADDALIETAIRWLAGKISEPGVGAAFAGVFVDAYSDPTLRELLSTRFQAPYLEALQAKLDQPEAEILLLIDVVAGTMLHRMGITGSPMAKTDVTALTDMVLGHFTGGRRSRTR
ncbi:TetR/AcrR family transcriptional regulator [Labedaea rhizosphaerae]|uniref:TetR family transcriptional regulator n=1 Tax=Labedaea rhizosphaerae TaxID=598644 RepID=A0A4R6S6D8_LABRH|nr:TetR/AcrR family transcriptional regulator [Labedaea rhizosphaerae]TDP94913.1 TetR family transcriptional regulator [Labedaea rhizosphaerae]